MAGAKKGLTVEDLLADEAFFAHLREIQSKLADAAARPHLLDEKFYKQAILYGRLLGAIRKKQAIDVSRPKQPVYSLVPQLATDVSKLQQMSISHFLQIPIFAKFLESQIPMPEIRRPRGAEQSKPLDEQSINKVLDETPPLALFRQFKFMLGNQFEPVMEKVRKKDIELMAVSLIDKDDARAEKELLEKAKNTDKQEQEKVDTLGRKFIAVQDAWEMHAITSHDQLLAAADEDRPALDKRHQEVTVGFRRRCDHLQKELDKKDKKCKEQCKTRAETLHKALDEIKTSSPARVKSKIEELPQLRADHVAAEKRAKVEDKAVRVIQKVVRVKQKDARTAEEARKAEEAREVEKSRLAKAARILAVHVSKLPESFKITDETDGQTFRDFSAHLRQKLRGMFERLHRSSEALNTQEEADLKSLLRNIDLLKFLDLGAFIDVFAFRLLDYPQRFKLFEQFVVPHLVALMDGKEDVQQGVLLKQAMLLHPLVAEAILNVPGLKEISRRQFSPEDWFGIAYQCPNIGVQILQEALMEERLRWSRLSSEQKGILVKRCSLEIAKVDDVASLTAVLVAEKVMSTELKTLLNLPPRKAEPDPSVFPDTIQVILDKVDKGDDAQRPSAAEYVVLLKYLTETEGLTVSQQLRLAEKIRGRQTGGMFSWLDAPEHVAGQMASAQDKQFFVCQFVGLLDIAQKRFAETPASANFQDACESAQLVEALCLCINRIHPIPECFDVKLAGFSMLRKLYSAEPPRLITLDFNKLADAVRQKEQVFKEKCKQEYGVDITQPQVGNSSSSFKDSNDYNSYIDLNKVQLWLLVHNPEKNVHVGDLIRYQMIFGQEDDRREELAQLKTKFNRLQSGKGLAKLKSEVVSAFDDSKRYVGDLLDESLKLMIGRYESTNTQAWKQLTILKDMLNQVITASQESTSDKDKTALEAFQARWSRFNDAHQGYRDYPGLKSNTGSDVDKLQKLVETLHDFMVELYAAEQGSVSQLHNAFEGFETNVNKLIASIHDFAQSHDVAIDSLGNRDELKCELANFKGVQLPVLDALSLDLLAAEQPVECDVKTQKYEHVAQAFQQPARRARQAQTQATVTQQEAYDVLRKGTKDTARRWKHDYVKVLLKSKADDFKKLKGASSDPVTKKATQNALIDAALEGKLGVDQDMVRLFDDAIKLARYSGVSATEESRPERPIPYRQVLRLLGSEQPVETQITHHAQVVYPHRVSQYLSSRSWVEKKESSNRLPYARALVKQRERLATFVAPYQDAYQDDDGFRSKDVELLDLAQKSKQVLEQHWQKVKKHVQPDELSALCQEFGSVLKDEVHDLGDVDMAALLSLKPLSQDQAGDKEHKNARKAALKRMFTLMHRGLANPLNWFRETNKFCRTKLAQSDSFKEAMLAAVVVECAGSDDLDDQLLLKDVFKKYANCPSGVFGTVNSGVLNRLGDRLAKTGHIDVLVKLSKRMPLLKPVVDVQSKKQANKAKTALVQTLMAEDLTAPTPVVSVSKFHLTVAPARARGAVGGGDGPGVDDAGPAPREFVLKNPLSVSQVELTSAIDQSDHLGRVTVSASEDGSTQKLKVDSIRGLMILAKELAGDGDMLAVLSSDVIDATSKLRNKAVRLYALLVELPYRLNMVDFYISGGVFEVCRELWNNQRTENLLQRNQFKMSGHKLNRLASHVEDSDFQSARPSRRPENDRSEQAFKRYMQFCFSASGSDEQMISIQSVMEAKKVQYYKALQSNFSDEVVKPLAVTESDIAAQATALATAKESIVDNFEKRLKIPFHLEHVRFADDGLKTASFWRQALAKALFFKKMKIQVGGAVRFYVEEDSEKEVKFTQYSRSETVSLAEQGDALIEFVLAVCPKEVEEVAGEDSQMKRQVKPLHKELFEKLFFDAFDEFGFVFGAPKNGLGIIKGGLYRQSIVGEKLNRFKLGLDKNPAEIIHAIQYSVNLLSSRVIDGIASSVDERVHFGKAEVEVVFKMSSDQAAQVLLVDGGYQVESGKIESVKITIQHIHLLLQVASDLNLLDQLDRLDRLKSGVESTQAVTISVENEKTIASAMALLGLLRRIEHNLAGPYISSDKSYSSPLALFLKLGLSEFCCWMRMNNLKLGADDIAIIMESAEPSAEQFGGVQQIKDYLVFCDASTEERALQLDDVKHEYDTALSNSQVRQYHASMSESYVELMRHKKVVGLDVLPPLMNANDYALYGLLKGVELPENPFVAAEQPFYDDYNEAVARARGLVFGARSQESAAVESAVAEDADRAVVLDLSELLDADHVRDALVYLLAKGVLSVDQYPAMAGGLESGDGLAQLLTRFVNSKNGESEIVSEYKTACAMFRKCLNPGDVTAFNELNVFHEAFAERVSAYKKTQAITTSVDGLFEQLKVQEELFSKAISPQDQGGLGAFEAGKNDLISLLVADDQDGLISMLEKYRSLLKAVVQVAQQPVEGLARSGVLQGHKMFPDDKVLALFNRLSGALKLSAIPTLQEVAATKNQNSKSRTELVIQAATQSLARAAENEAAALLVEQEAAGAASKLERTTSKLLVPGGAESLVAQTPPKPKFNFTSILDACAKIAIECDDSEGRLKGAVTALSDAATAENASQLTETILGHYTDLCEALLKVSDEGSRETRELGKLLQQHKSQVGERERLSLSGQKPLLPVGQGGGPHSPRLVGQSAAGTGAHSVPDGSLRPGQNGGQAVK